LYWNGFRIANTVKISYDSWNVYEIKLNGFPEEILYGINSVRDFKDTIAIIVWK
jgi:hypothetical protein